MPNPGPARLRKFNWSKSYYIVWADGRRSHRLSTCTSKKSEAEKQLALFRAGLQKPPEDFAVNHLIDAYLSEHASRSQWHKNREYEFRSIRQSFGNLSPSMINPFLVRDFTSMRRRSGKADGTIDKELRMLRAALSWGVKEQWMEHAPYIETPGGAPPRDRYLTREEARRLLRAAEEPHIRLFIALALYTGARTNAILRLTWDKLDFERDLVLFRPAGPRSKKRAAIVPINHALKAELAAARQFAQTEWVVEFRGRPITSVKTGFRAAVRRAGIDHCTPHDLRRTCASWMVQEGIPLDKVARYLGDTRMMIEKVYGHHSPDYLREAANVLNN